MCNEVARRIALGQLREDWSQLRIPLLFPEGAPNMAPLDSVRITDPTVIVRAGADGAADLVTRRWSWPMANGRPLYNFRSEGRRFTNSATGGRCLVPVDGFYEFTAPEDPKSKRKTKWLFTPTPGGPLAGDYLMIAGLWHADSRVGQAFTLLTCAPGPDVAPLHSRQVVLMPRTHWGAWIGGDVPSAELIAPSPAGSLSVARVG
ncbi:MULTISPECIES: SOS response-associated peptidase family protein [Sphingomonas]|uniref:SOS response-associated peptidase family protein n=1 Tax=Sphingomonas TaxID=13687 RepID=UPI0008313C8A|nr:SOS response-associated peptidase family protein [Sphingomonas sp. CCH10-B3]